MILSDIDIEQQLNEQRIGIEPYTIARLNPNSYNLTLAPRLLMYTAPILDSRTANPTVEISIPDSGRVLEPGRLYLGSTNETTNTPYHVPLVEGRSSLGRLGLFVHVSAGFGDVGFNGRWTLEIAALHPIKIYPGMEICQIYFNEVRTHPRQEYKGKYQHAVEAVASKLYEDFRK
jgi:dCTP deaminase